ncbi:hypothetical protein [Pseudonocardia phyllosphaerae]|uniref:hypothetical protein n=1 Tax=Pseudonocardia phyllosphaerae TaxID=3390502 RepID=UPI0039790BCE
MELRWWKRVAQQPRRALQDDRLDWVFVGSIPRDTLEAAMSALSRRHRAALRRQVARWDALFIAKTVNNPDVPTELPWWKRRM